MPTLNPAPDTLGLDSPVLGPWFSDNTLTLGAPDADLAVALAPAADIEWLPPASGLLSFYIATATRPQALAGLRNAAGDPAFTTGRLVALFRLLPGVEERLHALSVALPSLTGGGSPAAAPSRPRVRYFALELNTPPAAIGDVVNLLPTPVSWPPGIDTDEEQARFLGLTTSGGLGNADRAMSDMVRPGIFSGSQQRLLRLPAGTGARLWTFDHRGRPVDPGAVACWWLYMATHNPNGYLDASNNPQLWAQGVSGADRRTAPITGGADQLTLHLVNAHEGPLGAVALGRLNLQNLNRVDSVCTYTGGGTAAGSVAFTAAPAQRDDFPMPQVALLPDGTYGSNLSLWGSGTIDPILQRDFARVAIVSMEHQLLGQERDFVAPGGATAAEQIRARRAAEQESEYTRVTVARANRPALQATHEQAIAGLMGVFGGGGGTRLACSVLERDWGALTAGTLPDVDPPTSAPAVTVSALVCNNTIAGSTVSGQKALVELTLPGLAGAWVRAWTQGFDEEQGVHYRLDGGAGRVRADGTVSLVVPLADGSIDTAAPMGLDLLVSTGRDERLFADLRFDRPTPVAGGLLDWSTVGSQRVVVCEAGLDTTAPLGAGSIPSGAQVVVYAGATPSLVERSTVPGNLFATGCVVNNLAAGDTVRLTQPAFQASPTGELETAFTGTGATVTRQVRSLASAWQAGYPLPGMERLEVVAANVDGTGALAAVATVPPLARYHELLPHRSGHPQCPAAVEVHGTGVSLSGPAAAAVAEHVRDRVCTSTVALAQAATTPLQVPSAPTSNSLWAAGLRTVAAGVDAEVGLTQLITSYPYFGTQYEDKKAWLEAQIGTSLPSAVDDAARSAARALDRRMLASAYGAREGATSLIAAIQRAEDFIYIETPALDDLELGAADDKLHLWQALKDRMDARRGLRVVVCLPLYMMAGTPAPLYRVRNDLIAQALASMQGGGTGRGGRFISFQPSAGPGRSLRLASTTVIVDDAYVLTGTTHLWRRGLSFDASYAVAVFDDQLTLGRPAEITTFRRSLVAGRLGLPVTSVPDDPEELVSALRTLKERGGFGRLVTESILPPDPSLTTATDPALFTEASIWNPDGSGFSGFNPLTWLAGMMASVQAEELTPAP